MEKQQFTASNINHDGILLHLMFKLKFEKVLTEEYNSEILYEKIKVIRDEFIQKIETLGFTEIEGITNTSETN
jgi:hypothetical protein